MDYQQKRDFVGKLTFQYKETENFKHNDEDISEFKINSSLILIDSMDPKEKQLINLKVLLKDK